MWRWLHGRYGVLFRQLREHRQRPEQLRQVRQYVRPWSLLQPGAAKPLQWRTIALVPEDSVQRRRGLGLGQRVGLAKTAKTSAAPATNSAPPATTPAIGTSDHSKRSKPATASETTPSTRMIADDGPLRLLILAALVLLQAALDE
jgi:hypothetical protein